MSMTVKIRKQGNSLGVSLPRDVLTRADLHEGDELFVAITSEGVTLSPFDPDFAAAMEAYAEVEPDFRNAMRALSKV